MKRTNEHCMFRICVSAFFLPRVAVRSVYEFQNMYTMKKQKFHLLLFHNSWPTYKEKLPQIITLSLNIWQTIVHTMKTNIFIQPSWTNTHKNSFCPDICVTQSAGPFIKALKMAKLFVCLLSHSFSSLFSPFGTQ